MAYQSPAWDCGAPRGSFGSLKSHCVKTEGGHRYSQRTFNWELESHVLDNCMDGWMDRKVGRSSTTHSEPGCTSDALGPPHSHLLPPSLLSVIHFVHTGARAVVQINGSCTTLLNHRLLTMTLSFFPVFYNYPGPKTLSISVLSNVVATSPMDLN